MNTEVNSVIDVCMVWVLLCLCLIETVEAKCDKVAHHYLKSIDYAGCSAHVCMEYMYKIMCVVCMYVCTMYYMLLYACVGSCYVYSICFCVRSCVCMYVFVNVRHLKLVIQNVSYRLSLACPLLMCGKQSSFKICDMLYTVCTINWLKFV